MIRQAAYQFASNGGAQRRVSTFLMRQAPSTAAAADSSIFSIIKRTLTARAPGADPLELLQKESERRGLCDGEGYRSSGSHWAMALAAASADGMQAPNLRNVTIQRITTEGVDFMTKIALKSSSPYADSNPISFLYTVGKYKPGETVEQWRAEGACEPLDLGSIIEKIPDYAKVEIIASVRLAKENDSGDDAATEVSKERKVMGNQAHFMELVQQAKMELENGQIGDDELNACLGAWRFKPCRMERMSGGPDHIMWDRWEWMKGGEGSGWNEANHILPY